MKKLTPVRLSAETQAQVAGQTIERSAPKSYDPKNFPVFDYKAGEKYLIYVPNLNVQDADGTVRLMMDTPLIHNVIEGKRFRSYRCINGIVADEYGYDGTCPLCDGVSDPWAYARKRIEAKCSAQGLDPDDVDNKDVKAIRSAEFSDRVLKEAVRYYTFPIAVIETVTNEQNKMTFVKDESGNVKVKLYWYNISETQYIAKWQPTLESMEDEPSSPGGYFFILNFSYDTKGKEPNKRDAARYMSVNYKSMAKYNFAESLKKAIDDLAASWTPEKAQETVIANAFYSFDDLSEVAAAVLADTRNKLALYQDDGLETQEISAGEAPALPANLKKVEEAKTGDLEAMDATDEDFESV